MRNSFLTNLRYLSDGNRLYGRSQSGQALAILAFSIYLPLALPLIRTGAWTDIGSWADTVEVVTPAMLMAVYAVIVAIVIAISLTPSSTISVPLAPYPIERPIKTRIILNARLVLIAMLGFSSVGIIFTHGIDRLEHLVCLGLGALLLQLGHLDEVNAVQVEPVLACLREDPLARYDNWYVQKWGIERTAERSISHRRLSNRRLTAVALLMLVQCAALLAYVMAVHGSGGILRHALTIIFLAVSAGFLTIRSVEAVLSALMVSRFARGSRHDSWFSHVDTYFALIFVGSKFLTTLLMLTLPLKWITASSLGPSLSYLGFLGIELTVYLVLLGLMIRRWGSRSPHSVRHAPRFEREFASFARKKRAAHDRAAIRGAVRYRKHYLEQSAEKI